MHLLKLGVVKHILYGPTLYLVRYHTFECECGYRCNVILWVRINIGMWRFFLKIKEDKGISISCFWGTSQMCLLKCMTESAIVWPAHNDAGDLTPIKEKMPYKWKKNATYKGKHFNSTLQRNAMPKTLRSRRRSAFCSSSWRIAWFCGIAAAEVTKLRFAADALVMLKKLGNIYVRSRNLCKPWGDSSPHGVLLSLKQRPFISWSLDVVTILYIHMKH